MVALNVCPGRREIVVWASHWRRGRSGSAIGLTKVAHQSAVRAQHGPYCSRTEGRFSDIRRPHGDLADSLGRHGRSVVAVLCNGGFRSNIMDSKSKLGHVTEQMMTQLTDAYVRHVASISYTNYMVETGRSGTLLFICNDGFVSSHA